MAEFCKECFKRVLGKIGDDEELQMSSDLDLCEGCGKMKPVVERISKKVSKPNETPISNAGGMANE